MANIQFQVVLFRHVYFIISGPSFQISRFSVFSIPGERDGRIIGRVVSLRGDGRGRSFLSQVSGERSPVAETRGIHFNNEEPRLFEARDVTSSSESLLYFFRRNDSWYGTDLSSRRCSVDRVSSAQALSFLGNLLRSTNHVPRKHAD